MYIYPGSLMNESPRLFISSEHSLRLIMNVYFPA